MKIHFHYKNYTIDQQCDALRQKFNRKPTHEDEQVHMK